MNGISSYSLWWILIQHAWYMGHGNVVNLSRNGALVKTKHRVSLGEKVAVSISSKYCNENLSLPRMFLGTATVHRVEPKKDDISQVALEWGPEFADNIDFDLFIESLQHHETAAS